MRWLSSIEESTILRWTRETGRLEFGETMSDTERAHVSLLPNDMRWAANPRQVWHEFVASERVACSLEQARDPRRLRLGYRSPLSRAPARNNCNSCKPSRPTFPEQVHPSFSSPLTSFGGACQLHAAIHMALDRSHDTELRGH